MDILGTAPRTPDPAPRLSAARLLAGVFAGLVGGLAFGVLMSAPAVVGDADFGDAGLFVLLSRLIGTESIGALWAVHLVNAAVFGLVFAALVPPQGLRRTLAWAIGWSILLWFVGAFLLLRLTTGVPLALDAAALFHLAGHLAYGVGLGLVYGAFLREEERLMRDHAGTRRRTAL